MSKTVTVPKTDIVYQASRFRILKIIKTVDDIGFGYITLWCNHLMGYSLGVFTYHVH